MTQIKYIIIALIFTFSTLNLANASLIDDTKTEVLKTISASDSKSVITRADSFNFFSEYYLKDLPKSYKYINLNFRDVKKGTELYASMQKLIYVDAIENKNAKLVPEIKISSYGLYSFAEKVLGTKIIETSEVKKLKANYANLVDLYVLRILIEQKTSENETDLLPTSEINQKAIFDDVYNTLTQGHYNKDTISTSDMMYGAIEGLATGTKDKFTTYFPPVQKKQFSESLSGEYEGIGAYVDMTKPGELKIVSPLSGSPAEKAGLKANDIIIKIDNFELTKETTTDEAVSKIKGKAGTQVNLTIKRGTETLVVKVMREKVILKDVEGKSLSDEIYYMNIRMFGDHVVSDFKKSLEELKTKTNTKKLIIDLRNNPGGYLDSVSEILGYFVSAGEPVAVVKYKTYTQNYKSAGYLDYDFSKLKIVILVNEGSASASEIMVGTLKDYFPAISLIGEKTYGKGSVQTIKTYYDGSSLKYTIAKWFTGKTQTGIDGTGIKPDIEIKLDEEKKKSGIDNQLEEAKKL